MLPGRQLRGRYCCSRYQGSDRKLPRRRPVWLRVADRSHVDRILGEFQPLNLMTAVFDRDRLCAQSGITTVLGIWEDTRQSLDTKTGFSRIDATLKSLDAQLLQLQSMSGSNTNDIVILPYVESVAGHKLHSLPRRRAQNPTSRNSAKSVLCCERKSSLPQLPRTAVCTVQQWHFCNLQFRDRQTSEWTANLWRRYRWSLAGRYCESWQGK